MNKDRGIMIWDALAQAMEETSHATPKSSWQNLTPVAALPGVPSNLLSLWSDASEANSVAAFGGFNDQTPEPKPRLTKREAEILRWVAEGKGNAEIATILALSAHTVRNHLENILAKFKVETRTAAAAALRRPE